MPSPTAFTPEERFASVPIEPSSKRGTGFRAVLFIVVFLLVAGGGLLYNYSRPATYQAISRLSVEPPNAADEVAKAQFALSEAQAMRRSEFLQVVVGKLQASGVGVAIEREQLERMVRAEAVPQTNIIELRALGPDREQLSATLAAWVETYTDSRQQSDRSDEAESVEDARHEAQRAQSAVDNKRKELESFRRQHGIASLEREENPGTARLKGLHTALNEAATKEVNAEAKVKAAHESIAQGRGVLRAVDRAAVSNLETRAVDLREKMRSFEHDFTPAYLAMEPRYKALQANLQRVEQQIVQERSRSQKAALEEAQEELAAARRATQQIREQAQGLNQESQAFSLRFSQLKQMAVDLEQLEETRRIAVERLNKLESVRKPTAVKIRLLTVPSSDPEPVSPDYTRDAVISLAAGLILALAAVWVRDYLRKDPELNEAAGTAMQPVIQIAYSGPSQGYGAPRALPAEAPRAALSAPGFTVPAPSEIAVEDVAALWQNASGHGRLLLAALFSGIQPEELPQLRWKHVDIEGSSIQVPGASPRRIPIREPLAQEISLQEKGEPEQPLFADGLGNPLGEAALDSDLACIAHDAGLRRPEQVNAAVLHFTYAAYLARQGLRMSDLSGLCGRLQGSLRVELMNLSPSSSRAKSIGQVDLLYPGFRV